MSKRRRPELSEQRWRTRAASGDGAPDVRVVAVAPNTRTTVVPPETQAVEEAP